MRKGVEHGARVSQALAVVTARCGRGAGPDPRTTSCFLPKWLQLTVCGPLVPSVACCVPQVRPGCAAGTGYLRG